MHFSSYLNLLLREAFKTHLLDINCQHNLGEVDRSITSRMYNCRYSIGIPNTKPFIIFIKLLTGALLRLCRSRSRRSEMHLRTCVRLQQFFSILAMNTSVWSGRRPRANKYLS